MNSTEQTTDIILFEQYRQRYMFLMAKQSDLIDEQDDLHQKMNLAIQKADDTLYSQFREQYNSISTTIADLQNETDELYEKIREIHLQYLAKKMKNTLV